MSNIEVVDIKSDFAYRSCWC